MANETIPQSALTNTKVDGKPVVPSVTPSKTAEEAVAAQKASVADSEAELQRRAALNDAPTAPPPVTATSTEARTEADKTGVQVSDATAKLDAGTISSQSQKAYDAGFSVLENLANNAKADREQAIANIQKEREISLADTATSQRMEKGSSSMSLARMGGYLGGSGSGLAYMNSLTQSHRVEIEKLNAAYAEAIEKAKAAYDEKDIALANSLMTKAKEYQTAINDQRNQAFTEAKNALELLKLERDSVSATMTAIAETDKVIPESYFEATDKQNGFSAGVSKGIYNIVRKNKEAATAKTELEASEAKIKLASDLASTLSKVPAGTPIEVGGKTYYGTMGAGKIEIDSNGYGNTVTVDQATGKVSTKNIGFLGKPADGWQLVFDGDGAPWSFNKNSGQFIFAGDPTKTPNATGVDWSSIIPEGSIGGQCGRFVNNLTKIGFTDSLYPDKGTGDPGKVSKIDKTIGSNENPVQIGDAVVTSEGGWTGHVALVNSIIERQGKKIYILSESNYGKDEKVSHTRQISSDSPVIKGFARGDLDKRLRVGSDAPSFASKTTEVTVGGDRYRKNKETGEYEKVIEGDGSQVDKYSGLSKTTSAQVDALAKSFGNEKPVANFKIISEGKEFVDNLLKDPTNPANDQGLLYAFAKAMDPDSVVREGEYATIQKYSQSWAEQFGFKVSRIFSNSPFLTAESRDNLKKTINAKYQANLKQYKNLFDEYGRKIDNKTGKTNGTEFLTDYSKPWEKDQASLEQVKSMPVGSEFTKNGKKYRKTSETEIEPI